MKKNSLRLRLIILFVLISGIAFATAAFLSWKETNEKTDEFFDTYQMALARQLSSADWSSLTPAAQNITDKLIKHVDNADDEDEAIGFAVFNHAGKMVFHDNENGKYFAYAPAVGTFAEQFVDGEDWRIVWIASADGKYDIAVGQEMEYRRDVAWEMLEEFTFPWGIGACCLLLAMIFIISLEFMPINRLAAKLSRRSSDDLSPLDGKGLPTEIIPLTDAMNGLLYKVQKMLEQERSFIADSAHELRTPLTALKVQLEVLEMSQDDAQARNDALEKLKNGIERSSRLVEQLLALSKAETVQQDSINEPIFWQETIQQIIDDYAEDIRTKRLKTETIFEGNGPFQQGNPVLASLIVRNLTDNAVKYSPEGAKIILAIKSNTLSVFNNSAKIDMVHLKKLGSRFYRPAGQKQSGSGLGLAIVTRIAEIYGCSVSFKNVSGGFKVEISGH